MLDLHRPAPNIVARADSNSSRFEFECEFDCFLLFNGLGLLEIGIYKGNASELLGLSYDSPVNIIFEE